MDFIYSSSTTLELGSIVLPGNFGTNIASHKPSITSGWQVAREMIFENVRLRMRPHFPSRLTCNMLFTSTAAALALGRDLQNGILAARLYSVELVDPSQPSCIADFDAISQIQDDRFIESATGAAMRYWYEASEDMVPWKDRAHEFLTLSPIKIVRQLSGDNHFEHHCPVVPIAR